MDFQESSLIHQQKQEQPPPPHGHGRMVAPPPHTHKQEQTNSYMFPAKIIFHQPQQQKKRSLPRKSLAHGFPLSPTNYFESHGACDSEELSKNTCGRPQGFGEKNRSKNLVVNHEDSSANGDITSIASSKIPGKNFGRPLCSGNKQKEEALDAVEARWTQHLIFVHIGQGQYDIISLLGLLLLPNNDDTLGITGGLSVLLSRPDGSNICGIVAEMLKASSPVELDVSSYISKTEKHMPEASLSTC